MATQSHRGVAVRLCVPTHVAGAGRWVSSHGDTAALCCRPEAVPLCATLSVGVVEAPALGSGHGEPGLHLTGRICSSYASREEDDFGTVRLAGSQRRARDIQAMRGAIGEPAAHTCARHSAAERAPFPAGHAAAGADLEEGVVDVPGSEIHVHTTDTNR